MVQLQIIADDGVVGIDGVFKKVDLSTLDRDIHAVQIKDGVGHIEFKTKGKLSEPINTTNRFAAFIAAWHAIPEPPGPPPPPTKSQRVDLTMAGDPAFRGLVEVVAEDSGKTVAQVLARIKVLS